MTTKVTDISVTKSRAVRNGVNPLFVHRWSPRAMTGEELPEDDLRTLLEAARWAASSFNGQPWRFVYAPRGSEHFPRFVDCLVEFNQKWAEKAAFLFVVLSRTTFEHNGKPAPTHSLDTGAALQNLQLQASLMGLVSHAMGGFDPDKAREAVGAPEGFAVEAMLAVGVPGAVEDLPEAMREDEKPSDRKAIEEIAREGRLEG